MQQVSGRVLQNVIGPDGQPLAASVGNSGSVKADGGSIVMVSNASGEAFASAVNNSGVIEAGSLVSNGGSVVLAAGDEGTAQNSGTIDVSGVQGGHAEVTGAKVIQSGTVRADALDGNGGTVCLVSTERTEAVNGSLITANAGTEGNGGDILLWSDGVTAFGGAIEARGGQLSGDDGFVEVSGSNLGFNGSVDLLAPNGSSGTLLLDPDSITITNGAGNAYSYPQGAGAVTIGETNLEGVSAAIILEADGDITINDLSDNLLNLSSCTGLTIRANRDGGTSGDFSMNTGDTINVGNGGISIYGANITTGGLTAAGSIGLYTHTSSGSGTISTQCAVSAGGSFTASYDSGSASAFSNSASITAATNVSITASTINAGSAINAGGNVTFNASGNITGSGLISGSTVSLTTTGSGSTIGTSGVSPLSVNAATLNASTVNGNIWLTDTLDGVAVGNISAGSGNVTLTANSGSITESGSDRAADISGSTVTLTTTGSGNAIG